MASVALRRSSRPTTSAASTATQIDGDVAEQIGRAFARVLADLAGKPAGELRVGLGRDMRLTAPELAARYRDGHGAPRARTSLDAGMVGTEMLYFLVGSRELDGGLMCTASHNPKAYTGAKLVERGRDRRSPATRASSDIRRAIEAASATRRGGGSRRGGRHLRRASSDAALRLHRPGERQAAEGRRRRRQRHGRPDGRPAARATSGSTSSTTYWEPDGDFPDHEPNPLLRGEPPLHRRQGARDGRRPRHRLGRRRRPLLLHRRHGRVRRRRLPDRAAGRVRCWRSSPARDDPLRRARLARRPRHRRRAPAARALVNRVGHAFFKTPHARRGRDLRRRGLRPLLLPRLLQRRLRDDPGAADARAAVGRGHDAERAARALPLDATSSPARSTPRWPTARRKMAELEERYADARDLATSTASRSTTTTGTSTCAPRTPSRCCACASESLVSAARTWSAAATRCSALIRS